MVTTLVPNASAVADLRSVVSEVLVKTGDSLNELPAERWSAELPQLVKYIEDDDLESEDELLEQNESQSDPEMVEAARRYLDDIYELYGASDDPARDVLNDEMSPLALEDLDLDSWAGFDGPESDLDSDTE